MSYLQDTTMPDTTAVGTGFTYHADSSSASSSSNSSRSSSPGASGTRTPDSSVITNGNDYDPSSGYDKEIIRTLERKIREMQIEREFFTKQSSINEEVAALKRKHEAEITVLKQQAETSHKIAIARITKQYQDRLAHDVEAGIKERWNVLQTLGSLGSMSVSTSTLVGICADCDEKKSELATLKAQYDALQGVFKRSVSCVHCAVKECSFNEAIRQGWEMKAELEKANEELKAENEKLKAAVEKSKTDHSGLLALLLEKNADASQLQKEREQLQLKASCANCLILEEQANKLTNHCAAVELQAREEIARLHTREQWLLQEGNRLVNDFQGERTYLQNEVDRRQNLLDDRQHQQSHRHAQSNGHNSGKGNNWNNNNGKGGGKGYHSDGNHNYNRNKKGKAKNWN